MCCIANVLIASMAKKTSREVSAKTGEPRISLLSLLSGARGLAEKRFNRLGALGCKQNQFRPRSRYDQEAVFAMQSGI